MSYYEFPHTRTYDEDLGWLINAVNNLIDIMKTFVATESLKFADPITWNITTQYEKSTIVIDLSGNAYLSLQPVPSGIQLNNDEYWLEIFNFTAYTRTANRNLTINVESNTTRATGNYSVDDWLIWEDVLYKVTSAISIDDILVIGINLSRFTVEDFCRTWQTYMVNTIQQYKYDIDASEAAYQQAMQDEVDRILAGATVDSEVIDARLGADGVNYTTLGNAIRTQFTDVHNTFVKSKGYTPYTLGAYIALSSYNVGDTVDLTPTSDTSWQYAVIPCKPGQHFYSRFKGGATPRAWALLDKDDKLIKMAAANADVYDIYIPANCYKLVLNDLSLSYKFVFYDILKKVDSNASVIKNTDNMDHFLAEGNVIIDKFYQGSLAAGNGGSGHEVDDSSIIRTDYIPLDLIDKISFTGISGIKIAARIYSDYDLLSNYVNATLTMNYTVNHSTDKFIRFIFLNADSSALHPEDMGVVTLPIKSTIKHFNYGLRSISSPIIFNDNEYIVTNVDIGDPVTLTPVTDSVWRSAVVDCLPGDVLILNNAGGTNPQAYAFIDDSGNLVNKSGIMTAYTLRIVEVPEGSVKAIINDLKTNSELGECYVVPYQFKHDFVLPSHDCLNDFIVNDYANNLMAHCSSLKIYNGIAYVCYYANNTTTYEGPSSMPTTKLYMGRFNICKPEEVTTQLLQEANQIFDNYTCGNKSFYDPNITIDSNDDMHIFVTGFDDNDVAQILKLSYDMATDTLSDNIVKPTINSQPMTISGFKTVYDNLYSTDIDVSNVNWPLFSSNIIEYDGLYYSVLSLAASSSDANALIVHSSDLIDWTVLCRITGTNNNNETAFTMDDNYIYTMSRFGNRIQIFDHSGNSLFASTAYGQAAKPQAVNYNNGIYFMYSMPSTDVLETSWGNLNRAKMYIERWFFDGSTLERIPVKFITSTEGIHYPSLDNYKGSLYMTYSCDRLKLDITMLRANIAFTPLEI